MPDVRWLAMCVLAACLQACGAVDADAQPGGPVSTPAARVRVIIDEQRASDRLRAQTYALIAQSVPAREWPTVQLAEPTTVTAVLDDYYDIFRGGSDGVPLTHSVLSEMIVSANREVMAGTRAGELPAGPISLPPIPVRAYSRYELNEVVSRRFDPTTMTYELSTPLGATVLERDEPIQRARADPAARRGRFTEVVLTVTPEVAEGLREYQSSSGQQARLVVDDEAGGMATMTLLQDQAGVECDNAAAWLADSPYLASLRLALSASERQRIEAAAANVPFSIVDWNVSQAGGHGAKVRAVVTEVLNALGLPMLDRFVETVELNPAHNREGLGAVLGRYKAYLLAPDSDLATAFEPAERWVETHVAADEQGAHQRIPSLVVQAVFWDMFRRARALNFSFTTDSAALMVLDPHFTNASVFGAFAAGNDGTEASVLQQPQAEAHRWPNIVNVTHGRRDGAINGNFSNLRQKVMVSVVAPGCGFSTPPLGRGDTGSSFASPYVATAAWVRMLQGFPAASMKRALINASLPLAQVGTRVESGGLFDPALFLVHPARHVLTPDGIVLPLSTLSFTMSYEAEGLGITLDASTPGLQPFAIAFSACASPTGVCATVRTWRHTGELLILAGPVRSLALAAMSGERRIDADVASLLTSVKLITF